MPRTRAASRDDGHWFEPKDTRALVDLARAYDALSTESPSASVIRPESVRSLLGAAARTGDFTRYEAALRREARHCAEMGLRFEVLEAAYGRLAGEVGGGLVRRYAHLPRRLLAAFEVLKRLMTTELSVLTAEYGSAQQTAHEGDGVIATDDHGAVIRMNRAAERMVGWTFSEAAGRRLADVFQLEEHDTGEELAEVLREGRVAGLPKHPTLRRRDGSAACSVVESMAPVHAEDGSIRGAVLVFRDQRVEIAHHQALEASMVQMLATVETSLDGLITVDDEGRVSDFNAAAERMFGYDRDAVVGVPFRRLILPQHPREIRDQALGGASSAQRIERRAVRADGRPFPVEIAITRMQGSRSMAFICFVRDLTASREAEAALKRSGEQLRALAARVQAAREEERTRIARELHDELGQQLTALRMDLGWLAHRQEGAPPDVVERVDAMSEIVDSTFAMVRRIATELRPGILDDLGLVAALEWQAGEFEARSGIAVEVRAPPDLGAIDPHRATAIFRIFQEILTNVARHSGARCVRAALEHDGGVLRLAVTDDGRGIRDDEMTKLDSLGLLGMRERAALLAGTFEVGRSERGGTRVTVRLPDPGGAPRPTSPA